MRNTNRYFTGLIVIAAVVIFSGFIFLHGLMRGSTIASDGPEISYNMPRPKSALYNFFFGLGDREIQRNEIDPFKNKTSTTSASADSVRKQTGKAAVDAKAAAAKAAVAKAAAAKTAAATAAANARKKAEVKVNVIGKDDNRLANADGTRKDSGISQAPTQYYKPKPSNSDAGPATEQKEGKLSSAQWRSLVVGQPTKENIAKLVKAFGEKEVDAGTLYLIMNDLAQSSNPETQAASLSIAQQVPSLRSFTVVSNNYEKFDPSVKKSADTYFLSYMQGSKLNILAMALQSDDTAIVHRAAQVMVAGLQTVRNNPTTDQQSRLGRGIAPTSAPKSPYAQFIPLFQQLEKSPDSSISSLSQNALSQLQALPNS